MSMNQYMHPRNIYKQPPNFKQLALEYPEFRKHIKQELSGKITVDFKNVEALRALTCTLLKKDFGLELQLPLTKLIPTVPLRLNYILWIEDLLNLANRTTGIKGIDIGTGASCIYPLLGAKKNKWSFVATEIDADSIKYAEDNVKRNSLQELVVILHHNANDTLLEKVVSSLPGPYDFCMCNPPFFGSVQELNPFFKSRTQNRAPPRNAFVASKQEVVSNGGEIEYISNIINESKRIGTGIWIYTTMVGHKSSLPPLKKLLRESEVTSFKQTEFCQGHTTRWGLAWTFHDIDLTKIPGTLLAAKQQAPKPLFHEIAKGKDFKEIHNKLVGMFKELHMECYELKHIKNYAEFDVTAHGNTWSHQRRKRREMKRTSQKEVLDTHDANSSGSSSGSGIHETCDLLSDMDFDGGNTKKRAIEENEENEYYNKAKKIKSSLASVDVHLKANVCLAQDNSSAIMLKLSFIEGSGGKEALHQVMQYIKNNLKL